jgi:pyruvate/oxaloacetate carboxyltransferase
MEKVFKYYKKTANVIDCRPADLLKPEMDAARDSVKGFTSDIGDILIAAIYPLTGVAFLKKKYGIETPPAK